MEVEVRKNGTLAIRLTPSDGIDKCALDQFVAQSQLGRKVLISEEAGVTVLQMEGK